MPSTPTTSSTGKSTYLPGDRRRENRGSIFPENGYIGRMAELGKTNTLIIVRESDHGFYLDGGELGEILLPNREKPEDLEQGDEIEVFVSRDSEDRIVATTSKPIAEVGQFAALEVTALNPRLGAFLDWGLPKELLLPFREQTVRPRVGDRVVVYIMIDERSNRIVATGRTNRLLNRFRATYRGGEKVSLIVQEKTPLGFMMIVDQQFRGLIHKNRINKKLAIGDTLEGYVASHREEGKIDLSLEPVGYTRVDDLSSRILSAIEENGGTLPMGDKSSPEEIKERFQTSKKAFKQALGSLYRERKINLSGEEISLVKPSA